MKAMQDAYQGPPQFTLRRIVGSDEVWIVELTGDYNGRIYHVANILEFRDGKIARETRYYAEPLRLPPGECNGLKRCALTRSFLTIASKLDSDLAPERHSS